MQAVARAPCQQIQASCLYHRVTLAVIHDPCLLLQMQAESLMLRLWPKPQLALL